MVSKKRFFLLEEEEKKEKTAIIKKIPDVIGQVSFARRFDKEKYIKDLENDLEIDHDTETKDDRGDIGGGGESFIVKETKSADKKLVIKVLPVAKAPRDRKRLESQILYVGKMIGVESKFSLEERLYGDLYDQNHKIINNVVDVKSLSGEWERAEGVGNANSRHIILSVGEKVDKQKATAATKLFLEDVLKSKGFSYLWAGHFDTKNDHFHVVVKKRNNFGENLRFSKDDLFVMMQKYSEYLEMVGIKRTIMARRDQKRVIKNVEERVEHMKNDNDWYQSKLAKGNAKDFNAYNYKANLAGRIEEEIGVLEVRSFLEKEFNHQNTNLVNRLRKNIKNDGVERVVKSLVAVKQMMERGLKIDSLEGLIVKAVEKKYDPRPEKQKSNSQIKVRNIADSLVMERFKAAALEFHQDIQARADILSGMDEALTKAFSNNGKKIRFGKSDSCELVWYGAAGYLSDYRTNEVLKWGKNKIENQEGFEVSREVSLEQLEKETKIKNEKIEKEKQERELSVADKATKLFYSYSQIGKSDYLVKKGLEDIIFPNVRFSKDGMLVVPVNDVNGKIWSLHYISRDSSKKFLTGGKKRENFFILRNSSQTKPFEDEDKILLAEGFATAATINKATNRSVVVFFNASNVEGVLSFLVGKFPTKEFCILADNDLWQEKNVGREKAEKAAEKYGAKVILPNFTLAHKDEMPTDFNDLHKLSGIDEVRNQIEMGFQAKSSIRKIREEDSSILSTEGDVIQRLKILKKEMVELTDKRDIKQKVDEIIKTAAIFNKDLAANLDAKLNSDDVKYGYIQPKDTVKRKSLGIKGSL